MRNVRSGPVPNPGSPNSQPPRIAIPAMPCIVRPFEPRDRAAVRRICADTGCMGTPIDPVFCDRDVFADYLTRYYTDWEPESASVAVDDTTGEVVGYRLGCRRPDWNRFAAAALATGVIFPKGLWRLATFQYDRASLRFLRWIATKAGDETPPAPEHAAHFHINLLPAYRNGEATRRLIFPFVEQVARDGRLRGVYGQMQVRDDRRTARVFERYGFEIIARRRITKFDHLSAEPIYLATIYREFKRAIATNRISVAQSAPSPTPSLSETSTP